MKQLAKLKQIKLSEQLRLKIYSTKTYTLNICIQEKKKGTLDC